MKIKITNVKIFLLMLSVLSIISSCSFEEVVNLDGPSVDAIRANASKSQLNQLVVGIESSMRNSLLTERFTMGTLGRELYLFSAEPRNRSVLLGENGVSLGPQSGEWNSRYRNIKNSNLLLEAVANTEAVTEIEANGYKGFANTIIAYELIRLVKFYDQARVDVSDPENLGPILDRNDVLARVRTLLDEAQTDLNSAGDDFVFYLSSGFNGFDTPAGFAQFNRAIAAVAAVYAKDGSGALAALSNSYFDLMGDLDLGPKHVFGLGGGDQDNPLFRVPSTTERPNNADQIIVHNSFIKDAEAGDLRVKNKTAQRPDPVSLDNLNGTHETRLYPSLTSPVDIIRNEELILVYAEANILVNNLAEATKALNIIRNSAGLSDYSGVVTSDGLTKEMLRQRRYSLWFEGHRMFDLRRYGLSNTLPIDRPGDQIFNVLPIPLEERE